MTNPQHPTPQPDPQAGPGHPAGQHPGQQYDPQPAHYGYTQQPSPHGYAQQPGAPGYAQHPGASTYMEAAGHPQNGQQQGAHPQGGQPPHPGQPTPAKRRKPLWKRWWFWLLAIIALFIIISAGGGDDSAEDASASADSGTADESAADASGEDDADEGEDEAPAEAASEYGVGDAVATGDWEVTVNDVASGVSELGDEFLGTTAQGQFILVDMSVANTGSEPSFFFESDVSLQDAEGNTYSPDTEAGIYAATDSDVMLLEEINPGNTATGVIVYDVPADVTPNVLEFQGGIFDQPATVALD
ncbi:DUF4352 domain-containing protein [Brevibacterium jeotgali]|uniref:DUF4352 domain-containing protein n=1 Tax=Brevibacterium jeotgali TaxID=1262550 RepID=A0A2H1L7H7_9MICO|nr:DUF4352 domain-containing protein [Brevibacterium jeotgali]TWC02258.1 uncharacterized protein DUF4352 [Brevibacterium jeotgali]SMY12690.1 protein of unknown function (DUF4352) [Brevibacterium jeotgali]